MPTKFNSSGSGQVATSKEAAAGKNTTKAITPATLKENATKLLFDKALFGGN